MPNRFSIQPANIMPGLSAALEGAVTGAEARLEIAKEGERQQKLQEGSQIIQTGTPEEIAEFSMQNPWAIETIDKALGFQSELTKQNAIESAKDILIKGASPSQTLINRAEFVIEQGGDAAGTMQLAEQAQNNPQVAIDEAEKVLALYDPDSLKAYRKLQAGDADGMEVAGIKEFEYLTAGLPEEEKARARRVKLGLTPRASEDAATKAEKQFASESAKLQARLGLEPQVAGAVQAAKNQATAEVKELGKIKSNESAWNVYDGAMSNLAQAMAGTETGPFAGFIPAITANAQIAEGAVAVMAPVLKSMFRASGEGTFTDKDQEMLLNMIPTRKDHPAARVAKTAAIDAIVRAKLGVTGVDGLSRRAEDQRMVAEPPPQYREGQQAQGPGGQILVYRNGNWEAM